MTLSGFSPGNVDAIVLRLDEIGFAVTIAGLRRLLVGHFRDAFVQDV